MHAAGEYDLAGFCVGVVDKSRLIDGSRIRAGDRLVGIGSSGPHSNGFSLIRKVLEQCPDPASIELDGQPLLEALLEPTRIYARQILALIDATDVKGLCHITGGGLLENIPRVLPAGLGARLERDSWQRAPVFDWLEQSGVAERELLRTFNCGLGMIVVVADDDIDQTMASLADMGEKAWLVGEVVTDAEHGVRLD